MRIIRKFVGMWFQYVYWCVHDQRSDNSIDGMRKNIRHCEM